MDSSQWHACASFLVRSVGPYRLETTRRQPNLAPLRTRIVEFDQIHGSSIIVLTSLFDWLFHGLLNYCPSLIYFLIGRDLLWCRRHSVSIVSRNIFKQEWRTWSLFYVYLLILLVFCNACKIDMSHNPPDTRAHGRLVDFSSKGSSTYTSAYVLEKIDDARMFAEEWICSLNRPIGSSNNHVQMKNRAGGRGGVLEICIFI